ncbi:uncharacterized protein BDV17DRAFT_292102 [Aspergillus undulatus]|uniref:uncharacterized protein n=1 Tax=Aspergillus undulatus TaxID=1810928 RepID=UPI003CCD66AC
MLVSMFVMHATSVHVGSPGKMWELLMAASEIRHLLTMKTSMAALLGSLFSEAACRQLSIYNPISAEVASQALEMPYAAYAIVGKGGIVTVLLMPFQAITSALSSETVAMTNLTTYDFYPAYIRPTASGKELIFVSHVAVVVYSILVSCVAVGLCYANFSVSFSVTAIGIIIDGAVIPSACTLFWRKQSKYAVTLAPIPASIANIGTWIGVAYKREGVVSVATLPDFYPCVAGNMLALTAPIVLTPLTTYIHPENYDFARFEEIQLVDYSNISGGRTAQDNKGNTIVLESQEALAFAHLECSELLRSRNIALGAALFIAVSITILWPFPMYDTAYTFSKNFLLVGLSSRLSGPSSVASPSLVCLFGRVDDRYAHSSGHYPMNY